ncbi:MAG: peptidylprolyl isomerase [Myxococcales bacterium]|nr:peptidylprolyl isomerase [Myxococcales bacterium]
MKALSGIGACLLLCLGCSKGGGEWTRKAGEGKELFATLKTSQGDVVVRLFAKEAPKTVQNFVGLAAGEREWTHPRTGEISKRPLYDGVSFHRVIPEFMIQGGDPLGTGTGGPGYKFEDEINPERRFDRPGILAMANSGPNTNGSQFFITVGAAPHLNGRHTIFGEVVKGYEVVEKISRVQRDGRDRPLSEVVIRKVELSDKAG